MKKSIIYILLVSFLLQSCFSYRIIDKNRNLAIGKKYKIKQFKKYDKVRLLSSTDSTITVRNDRNIENIISKKDIQIIKKRHFSVIKTALLPVGVAIVGVATVLAVGGGDLYKPAYGASK
ncbi:MAG: hypothetical protein H7174_03330 [Flavobacterium sp.]|nr:hypothetical protein [Flavobacterium sp.]